METQSKESLELQKLDEELKKLRLNWWQKPEYISAISSIIVGILGATATIAGAYIAGLFGAVANKQMQVQSLEFDRSNLNENILEARTKVLALQAEKARVVSDTQTDQRDQNLIIFSTDPSRFINKPFSAEFEVQIAKDKLDKDTIIFQRGNLYSTGILFKTKQEAKNKLEHIQKTLDRPAFITSLEDFCTEPRTKQQTSISGGANYPYTLYTCGTSNQ